jgi:DDE superfamily endonuclease/Archaeal putative transposase ISC1217
LAQVLALHFTNPTYQRFSTLLVGALVTTGRRTVANLTRTLQHLASGHLTDYQRVFSRAPWSGVALGCALARFLLRHFVPDGTVTLIGDDTVDGHKGKRVHGKARHRDPVRSSHAYTAWRYGHRWVVLAVLVRFPFATRPWALPVLVDLYRPPEVSRAEGRRHHTPAQLICRLLRLMLIRFPDRPFLFIGDSGYGTHAVARFCHRHRGRLALVSKLHPDANLFDPPPPYAGNGRPRVKGDRLPKPRHVAATTPALTEVTVSWYGGGKRRVGTVSRTGHWYKAGEGLVPLRWVFVRDLTGTHREEYFFTTDATLTPAETVAHYASRWNIETTFQELRAHLGLETTRGWRAKTVLRAAPCLIGLYAVVAGLFALLPEEKRVGGVSWRGKEGVTFSDALCAVRRWLWTESIFPQAGAETELEKLPGPVRQLLLTALAPAA